jgi:hypothetical protein
MSGPDDFAELLSQLAPVWPASKHTALVRECPHLRITRADSLFRFMDIRDESWIEFRMVNGRAEVFGRGGTIRCHRLYSDQRSSSFK